AALHAERWSERRLAQAEHRLLADVVERVGEADRGGGLAFAGRRRRDRRHENELAVRPILERLDEIHRDLGLVVAEGLEIFRREAERLACDLENRPLLRRLGDLDVGLGGTVLRGAGLSFHCGSGRRSHVSLVPTASLVVVANSPAATLGPS